MAIVAQNLFSWQEVSAKFVIQTVEGGSLQFFSPASKSSQKFYSEQIILYNKSEK